MSISGAHDPTQLPGLVAEEGSTTLGALTYRAGPGEFEVVTLNSAVEGRGWLGAVGRVPAAGRGGGGRLWLVTTNDNLRAIAF